MFFFYTGTIIINIKCIGIVIFLNHCNKDITTSGVRQSIINEISEDSSEQIAEAIRTGLYETTSRQNELLREQNELLRQILDKDTTVEVTANSVTKALNRKNQRDGKVIVPVGI